MNTFKINKRTTHALALLCLVPFASQSAQAAATFSSHVTVTYTIDSLANSTNAGDFSGLDITGSFVLAPGGDNQFITGEGSVTPSLAGSGNTTVTPAIGSSYSRTFQLDGTAINEGEVSADYLAWFGLAFANDSSDSYDIGLTLSYDLSANAAGNDGAFTDITLNFYNEDGLFSNDASPAYIQASTEALGSGFLQNSHTYNFSLPASGAERLYVDASITGELQASPVPVPSAIWLFASALLAIPGIRNTKKTV